jgi:hypothetical protein
VYPAGDGANAMFLKYKISGIKELTDVRTRSTIDHIAHTAIKRDDEEQ